MSSKKNFFLQNHNYTEDDAEEYVSHPLNTFSLIKRTAIDWPILKDKLFGDNIHDHAGNKHVLFKNRTISLIFPFSL